MWQLLVSNFIWTLRLYRIQCASFNSVTPAAYQVEPNIVVGASDFNGNLASFSCSKMMVVLTVIFHIQLQTHAFH